MWVSSIVNVSAPPTGINWDDINDTKGNLSQRVLYSQSKAGAIILAHEAAQRQGPQGIVSVSLSPGSLKTGLQRHLTSLATMAIVSLHHIAHHSCPRKDLSLYRSHGRHDLMHYRTSSETS